MIKNKTIAVVVPAFNEEKQIGKVIETMPSFVDRIIIVNDCSTDNTEEVVKSYIGKDKKETVEIGSKLTKIKKNDYNNAEIIAQQIEKYESKFFIPSKIVNKYPEKNRILLINHLKNGKKGAAVATGYKWCRDHSIDCTAIMDGDGQMDPSELELLCKPIVEEGVDYVKGNRLIHKSAYMIIPKIRYIGNSILSLLTKIASGYWHISDTQTGYTAISLTALKSIQLHKIYKDYGIPNDILVKLNISYCTIKEIEIKPVYNIGEESKMKILKVIPKISFLLFKLFFYRLWKKYLFRDFHPLFLLYHFGILLILIDCIFIYKIFYNLLFIKKALTFQSLFAFTIFSIFGFQSIIFAMWMDIMDNERLYK